MKHDLGPWLPMHQFPPEPEITVFPTTITQKCLYPGCEAETTYTRISPIVTRSKGWPEPFVCKRPDPRLSDDEKTRKG
jgi:hypothetical protein